MNEKILSLSIASYNVEGCLRECIKSLLIDEIIDDIEIIIVDDGSKDETLNIAKEYESKYPNSVVVIAKENGGHGSTINASIEVANGKYYKVLDADDEVTKDGIVKLVNDLKKLDVDLILNDYIQHDITTNKDILMKPFVDDQIKIGHNYCLNEVQDHLLLAMHAMTYRTTLLKNSNYRIDEHCFYVDMEYLVYYLLNVETIIYYDVPVYIYNVGNVNQSVDINNMLKRREQHLHVCKQLISFYKQEKDKMDQNKQEFFLKTIVNSVVLAEYRLLMAIPNAKVSKKEIMEYDAYLKEASIDMYHEVVSNDYCSKMKKTKLLKHCRKTSFFDYCLMHKLI